jgi:hypothetical protein
MEILTAAGGKVFEMPPFSSQKPFIKHLKMNPGIVFVCAPIKSSSK